MYWKATMPDQDRRKDPRSESHPRIKIRAQILPGSEPFYASPLASGADLRARLESGQVLELLPGQRALVPTGICLDIPPGFEAQVRPRSGLAARHGLSCLNSPGTIDADYRGEVKVILINLGTEPFVLEAGQRIAQLVFAPVYQAEFEITRLSASVRGEGGFGSTGL